MRSRIYDSFDPNLKPIPWVIQDNESDYINDTSDASDQSDTSDTGDASEVDSVHDLREDLHGHLHEAALARGGRRGSVGGSRRMRNASTGSVQVYPVDSASTKLSRRSTRQLKKRGKLGKKKGRKYSSKGKKERTTWEPGIDITTTTVFLNSPGSVITITDYCKERYRIGHYDLYSENEASRQSLESSGSDDNDDSVAEKGVSLARFLNEVGESKRNVEEAVNHRPDWSKVRWINVNGLSWEAISIIGKKYGLHPLSVEDLIDIPQRTKIDVYPNHLFMILPLLRLFDIDEDRAAMNGEHKHSKDDDEHEKEGLDKTMNSETEEHNMHDINVKRAATNRRLTDLVFIKQKNNSLTGRNNKKSRRRSSVHENREFKMSVIDKMRPLISKRLAVGVEQASIYMTNEGTVISFFERSADEVERAILTRLTTENTNLRESTTCTTLLHSIIDSIVDMMYPVMTAYTKVFNEKEVEVLTSRVPDFQHTQQLHVMLNELGMLKNTMMPISSLILQLKDLAKNEKDEFVDDAARMYLSDINDHLLSFIDEINSVSAMISNLIDLIFNTLSVDTNNSMQQLSLVTVLFLPLTFWAGFFGMNFTDFSSLTYGVNFFWELSVPFTVVLMMLVMYRTVWIFCKRIWRGKFQRERKGSRKHKKKHKHTPHKGIVANTKYIIRAVKLTVVDSIKELRMGRNDRDIDESSDELV